MKGECKLRRDDDEVCCYHWRTGREGAIRKSVSVLLSPVISCPDLDAALLAQRTGKFTSCVQLRHARYHRCNIEPLLAIAQGSSVGFSCRDIASCITQKPCDLGSPPTREVIEQAL